MSPDKEDIKEENEMRTNYGGSTFKNQKQGLIRKLSEKNLFRLVEVAMEEMVLLEINNPIRLKE